MDANKIQQIDALFQLWQDHPGAGGQLVVKYKGETFKRCYGFQNIETWTPMTQDSVFHLASVSKQVTAMCIYMLYEQGKLDLDDDVKKYLPDIVKVPQTITIKNLLHHTSGLPEPFQCLHMTGRNGSDTADQAEILRLLACVREADFTPGDEFVYSNANYVLMAEIVERVSGSSLNRFCEEHIFKPLGMTSTFVRDDPARIIPNRVQSYSDDGYAYKNATSNMCMYGSTNLYATARDINIFLHQYKNPTLISRETMENHMLTIPPLSNGTRTNYAGGVRINDLLGHKYIHHGGVNAGYRTVGQYYPDDDLIITLFANTYNIPIEVAARDVARILLDLEPRMINNLDEYTTDEIVNINAVPGFYYREKDGDNIVINIVDGKLCHNSTPLTHIRGNLYKQGRLNMWFAFCGDTVYVNEDNNIIGYRRWDDRISREQAEAYVGAYFCEVFQSYWKILWEGDKLWLYHIRHGKLQLHRVREDVFCEGLDRYTFLRDEQGRVVAMNRWIPSLRKALFKKM